MQVCRDAYIIFRRVRILVLRCLVRTATAPCARSSRYLLSFRQVYQLIYSLNHSQESPILHVDPHTSLPPDPSYYARVSKIHQYGGYGSTGYRAPWSHEESRKLLLRTHTTASSANMLWKLAAKCRGETVDGEDGKELAHGAGTEFSHDGEGGAGQKQGGKDEKDDGFRPAKLFSIDRVFRNETMDATHLAEFHQVEGVVADRGLTLADLIGRSASNVSSGGLLPDHRLCDNRVHESLLQENGNREREVQARVQPVHGGQSIWCSLVVVIFGLIDLYSHHLALSGNLCFPSDARSLG